ncbi:T9SS type A sorting domain-containing protein, partial [bacterium]|nr:T9SS type A sorting domain-containing protein [bacterium]
FLAKKLGSATITFSEAKLMDSGGKYMSFGSRGASLEIRGVASETASLWIEPKAIEVFKEEIFTATVSINVTNLLGSRVIVKYPGNLSLLDVQQGAFPTTAFLIATSTEKVEVILANVNGISGSGSLFSMRFLAKELGMGTITFELTDLRDTGNSPITVGTTGATISVKKRLICDFNQNNEIDFDDLLGLIGFWKKPNPIYDIGPVEGSPPNLISKPDGIVNFEDLMVFCLMWNWQKNCGSRIADRGSEPYIWMEEEGDWVVVKYKGLLGALGGRYILRFDTAVEIKKVEWKLKVLFWEKMDNNLILEFGFIDEADTGEVCRIQIQRDGAIKIQGEGEIRDPENKKISVESSELSLQTVSLKDSICYPNPSRIGYVKFNLPLDTKIQIYNIAGELVFSNERFDTNPTWQTKNIASGTYLYILTNGNDKKAGKIGVIK